MADVTDFVGGTPFTVRVRSSLSGNRRVRWHNTWEFRATVAGTISDIESLATNVGEFHRLMSFAYVTVDEVTVSSWVPDSHPYNPLGFATYPQNVAGAKSMLGELAVSLRNTLFVKRTAVSGLPGKLFLRGALIQGQLDYGDGEWVLDPAVGWDTNINTAITDSGMGQYFLGAEGGNFGAALIGNDLATRYCTGLDVAGTSDVKLNHKYFDRAPAP